MYVHCQDLHLLSHYSLEIFLNNSELSDLDPFVRLAIIHHHFESIHFFYDGNGRTGRIINILYMVKKELLYLPILCSSRYINQNKSHNYRLLQYTRDPNEWDEWVLFMLEAIEKTSVQTIFIIKYITR
ncbi:Fic family protein [Sphingobacterium daejeonense]|uniref:Fic family protein n=1 Tax=Sphingobacterium daejeonense TaxID=371142 RepID=UPI0035CD0A5D